MKKYCFARVFCPAAAAAVLTFSLCSCDFISSKLKYMLTPEPTVQPKTENLTDISLEDRQKAGISYGYDSLSSDAQRSAYLTIDQYINLLYTESFDVYGCDSLNFDRALSAYCDDHPEVFWLDSSSQYTYIDYGDSVTAEFCFTSSGDELHTKKTELSDKLEQIRQSAPADATDYEIELFVNSYIVDNCQYNPSALDRHNAYGALIGGAAVCDGYSKSFQLLCSSLGVECTVIQGDSDDFAREAGNSSAGHMWNCVQLDGEWYQTDVTWNDGGVYAQRFLYLNLTTDQITRDHTIGPLYSEVKPDGDTLLNTFVPKCTATLYNYYIHDGVILSNLDDDSSLIASLTAAARNRNRSFDIYVDEALDLETVKDEIAQSKGYSWVEAANYYNGYSPELSSESQFYVFSEHRVISMELDYI